MKRVFRIIGCTVIFIIICIAAFFAYRIFLSVTSIEEIEGQELIKTEVSPGGTYEAKAYLNNGGATVDYAVLVVLVDKKSNKGKNIYWNYHCEEANMRWISDEKIEINGIVLNVPDDVYDYRNSDETG